MTNMAGSLLHLGSCANQPRSHACKDHQPEAIACPINRQINKANEICVITAPLQGGWRFLSDKDSQERVFLFN